MNNFDTEVKKHKRHYEHTGCKFVISYSREGNNPGEKFDTVAVLNKVKQVISNNLTNAIHIVDKHEYQAMNSALGEIKCICGIIFIGHAGSTDGPSRLIFDNATSIATETDSTNSGRYLYSSLNTENFVQNNLSLLLGCRSASDKRFSKVLKMEFEKEGKFISIAEALSQHFKGTVIGSYNKLNFDGGVPYTPSHAGGNDFRIFYNYIQ